MPIPALATRPWLKPALLGSALLGGGVVLGDLLHGGASSLGLLAAASAGLWWIGGRRQQPEDRLPQSPKALLQHCRGLLEQFDALELPSQPQQQQLEQLEQLGERPDRHVVLAGAGELELVELLKQKLPSSAPLQLHLAKSLPLAPERWAWPEQLLQADLVIYALAAAPSAADLRWLEAAPLELPLLVLGPAEGSAEQMAAWSSQLGSRFQFWQRNEALPITLPSLTRQRQQTQLRCLRQLHGQWQRQLEVERRQRLQPLVVRSQWIVAAAVFASPLPSADLLLAAVINGLLLKEMAQLWRCQWTSEQLQAAALELGRCALSLGALEWGSQALAGLLKLHGATWLVGGALQALAAAYFTRVLARAMADYLALAAGVPDSELTQLKARLPVIVAEAAEQERLDWNGFADQASSWLKQHSSTSLNIS